MNNKKVLIIVGIIILVVGSGFGIWWFRRDTSEIDEFGLTRLDNELNEKLMVNQAEICFYYNHEGNT